MIPGVSGSSCMFKWLSLKKTNLADNCWNIDQSLLLDKLVKYILYYTENMVKIIGVVFHNNYICKIKHKIRYFVVGNNVESIGTVI